MLKCQTEITIVKKQQQISEFKIPYALNIILSGLNLTFRIKLSYL